MSSRSCHFCGKNIEKEFDALSDNVNSSKKEGTKENDAQYTKR